MRLVSALLVAVFAMPGFTISFQLVQCVAWQAVTQAPSDEIQLAVLLPVRQVPAGDVGFAELIEEDVREVGIHRLEAGGPLGRILLVHVRRSYGDPQPGLKSPDRPRMLPLEQRVQITWALHFLRLLHLRLELLLVRGPVVHVENAEGSREGAFMARIIKEPHEDRGLEVVALVVDPAVVR